MHQPPSNSKCLIQYDIFALKVERPGGGCKSSEIKIVPSLVRHRHHATAELGSYAFHSRHQELRYIILRLPLIEEIVVARDHGGSSSSL